MILKISHRKYFYFKKSERYFTEVLFCFSAHFPKTLKHQNLKTCSTEFSNNVLINNREIHTNVGKYEKFSASSLFRANKHILYTMYITE